MAKTRFITLSDGTGMGDTLMVFKTNAPVKELKHLENLSCKVYLDGGNSEDVPIWADVLTQKGYLFEFIDSERHVTPYGTSSDWVEKYEITENYVIENQP